MITLREAFEWSWWSLKEMRNLCTLCGKTFCNNCGTSKVQLKFVAASDGEGKLPCFITHDIGYLLCVWSEDKSEVQACLGCSDIVQSYYRKIQFEEMRRTAELNPGTIFTQSLGFRD